METLQVDPNGRRLWIGDRSWPVVELLDDTPDASVVVQLRPGVNAELYEGQDGEIWVSLWRGMVSEEVGLAVVLAKNGSRTGVAEIPLCSCGDRGCGNCGVQLSHAVAAELVTDLLDYLERLPGVPGVPTRGKTWLTEFDPQPSTIDLSD